MTDPAVPSGPSDALRRAPFGASPNVGARGQQTRHRILDAALRVFGEVGINRGSVERIAKEAGCSRAAFYQYFADKDDVLRNLAGTVRLQLEAAVAWLQPVTPDAHGWQSLRGLIERWAEIHERHHAVLDAFPAMFEADPDFANDATTARSGLVSAIAARVRDSDLSPGLVEGTVDLFLVTSPRVFQDLSTMRRVAPESFPETTTTEALTDVYHRALFGLDPSVNVREHTCPAPPRLPFGPLVRSGMERAGEERGDATTRATLLDAARSCFLEHGFHGTRIDTIAEAAGVSHGTLYTYFDSKDHVAQVLAITAMRGATGALQRMPTVEDVTVKRPALRRWLGEYNRAQAGETAMIRVWSEALRESGDPAAESAPTLDWGRRQVASRLAGRGFPGVDVEAAVLLGFLAALGSRPRPGSALDTAAVVIDRGFYGGPPVD